MGKEIPSIRREMDKLDAQEREKREHEAGAAFLRTFMKGFDELPPKDRQTILDLMESEKK